MSNFTNNNSKKRSSDSKYLNSFFPGSNINDEKRFNKRPKLDPVVTVVGSDLAKNIPRSNSVKGTNSSSNYLQNEVHELSEDIWGGFGLEHANKGEVCKVTTQDKSNSFFENDYESWFQSCLGQVVEKCTQIENEVGIEVSRIEVSEKVKTQLHIISSNSVSSSSNAINNVSCNSQRPKIIPLRRTSSGGDWPTTYNNSICIQKSHSAFSLRKSTGEVENGSLSTLESELQNLKSELKMLNELFQTKEGEVRVLRYNLDQTKSLLQKEKQERLKDNEVIQLEMNKKIRCYEREIHSLKAQLQFTKMDMVVAQSQQELHPPEFPKNFSKPNENILNGSVVSPKKVCNNVKETELIQEEVLLMQGDVVEDCDHIQSCQLLLELITPEMFDKSKSETTALDPPLLNSNPVLKSSMNKKERNCNSTDKEGCSTISLRTTCLTLEDCYQPLVSLTKMVDLSNKQAHQYFLKIIIESMKILEELLLRLKSSTLRERFMDREKEIYKSWQTYVPLNRDYSLLDFRGLHDHFPYQVHFPVIHDSRQYEPWYDEEKGVEARRCLGLLSILVQISRFVMLEVLPKSIHEANICGNNNELFDCEVKNDEVTKTRLILYTVRDIVKEIGNQRRTLSFEGVQAGAVQVIISLCKNDVELPVNSQELVLDILKGVIFSRPGSTVLVKVFEFLSETIRYPFITNQLCCNTARKTCIEDYLEITFTTDTCIVQMLCFMIRQLPEDFRYKLTNVFISWLYPLFVAHEDVPWLYISPDNTRCKCRSLITQLTFTLLGEVCRKYEKGDFTDKKLLEKVLPTGVFLVQNLIYQDEHFPVNVGDFRGELVLFLDAMNNFKKEINFNPVICNILEKLTKEEQSREFSTSIIESEELSSLLSSIYMTQD